ncbi:Gfo/Idh/MocA family oxidoreductase [Porifericola rhodea]|uniref:Gfo/Idh/MocA family protein n=1 Tax=Porifericola rhodea TaxID=930972 RepID=UPI002665C149|nr:Gfo/Idh/MocA family oxidoreductase [Porifericola rhodea]WKN30861.1 Gfo/Idh/MocA family oxidoreductase [Porifericola rhodea]
MSILQGMCVGAGYFSLFHYEAWQKIPHVKIIAVCDHNLERAKEVADRYDIPKVYYDYEEMFAEEKADFVDIITPPATHEAICKVAFAHKTHVICQKPLAPSFEEAKNIVRLSEQSSVRFMVHENFRFQPWHREIKKLVEHGEIGYALHTLNFRSRMGDGWGENAYLDRQPYFREMPRLLVFETGVHYIDTFRFLAGEIKSVYASLRKLNPLIAGEDAAMLFFEFESGAQGLWDANRYNESNHDNPRYTFGEFLVEGNAGSIRLYHDGKISIQKLGHKEREHMYQHYPTGFAGDCCYFTQLHFVEALMQQRPFETDGKDYLKTLNVQEAIYSSSKKGCKVHIY